MPGKKEETKKTKQETQLSLAGEGISERTTMHEKAGLIFPPARVLRLMKKGRYGERIGPKCAVGVAAVLEYLTAEILEVSGDGCYDGDNIIISSKIQPRHICLGVKGDEEMSHALGPHVIIPMSGVIPFIHEELTKKTRKRKSKSMDKFKDDEAQYSGSEEDSTEEDEEDEESEQEKEE